jgi:protein ImuB
MSKRHGASPGEGPRAFVEKTGNAICLAAANRAALDSGLSPGMKLADARARMAELEVHDINRSSDAALLSFLADACGRYSPSVSMDAPDGLTIDITGCTHLFGGEAGLYRDAMRRLQRWGMTVRAATGATAESARALAHFGAGGVTAEDEDAPSVWPLSVAALDLAPEMTAALVHLGLKTVGDVASQPRQTLAARFGQILVDRLSRTLAQTDVPPAPLHDLPACRVDMSFTEPVARRADIAHAIEALAREAAAVLKDRGQGGRVFEAILFRTDGQVRRVSTEASLPARDPALILRLFRERLSALDDELDPGFGFDLMSLCIARCQSLDEAQLSFEGREAHDVEATALIDALSARIGASRVLRFTPGDSHEPERTATARPALKSRPSNGWIAAPRGEPPLRPLTMFDPPQPITTMADLPDGPPVQFVWRRRAHRVARAEGPERIEREWWRIPPLAPQAKAVMPDTASRARLDEMDRNDTGLGERMVQADPARQDELPRDYYRVEDAHGRRFWIFRRGHYGDAARPPQWFVHGLFP